MTVALAIALAAFGLFTGIASGLLGVGGGTLMVPFLVFATTLGQKSAQATSLCVVVPTAIVATVVLHRRGALDTPRALAMGLLGAFGAVGGTLLALDLPADVLRVIFACFLGLVGLRLLFDARRQLD